MSLNFEKILFHSTYFRLWKNKMEPLYRPDVLQDRLIPRCHESMQQGFTTRITTDPKDILCFFLLFFFSSFYLAASLVLTDCYPSWTQLHLNHSESPVSGHQCPPAEHKFPALQSSQSSHSCLFFTTDPRVTWTLFGTPRWLSAFLLERWQYMWCWN